VYDEVALLIVSCFVRLARRWTQPGENCPFRQAAQQAGRAASGPAGEPAQCQGRVRRCIPGAARSASVDAATAQLITRDPRWHYHRIVWTAVATMTQAQGASSSLRAAPAFGGNQRTPDGDGLQASSVTRKHQVAKGRAGWSALLPSPPGPKDN